MTISRREEVGCPVISPHFVIFNEIYSLPYLSSNIPESPAPVVFVSQLIRYALVCSKYEDFMCRGSILVSKLLKQGYSSRKHQTTFRKWYGRHKTLLANLTLLCHICWRVCSPTVTYDWFPVILPKIIHRTKISHFLIISKEIILHWSSTHIVYISAALQYTLYKHASVLSTWVPWNIDMDDVKRIMTITYSSKENHSCHQRPCLL